MIKTKNMTNSKRFVNCVLGKQTDRGVLWADGLWGETRQRWINEGMTDEYNFGYDFTEQDTRDCFPLDYGFIPPFDTVILEDMGEKQRIIDGYGVEKIVMKDNWGLQQFIKYPVTGRKDWETLKKRLDPKASGRFGSLEKKPQKDAPVTIGGSHLCGFFSFLRETMGDDCYYMMYDDEGLVRDMLSFQAERIKYFIQTATSIVYVDRLFIWEDMCYKNGPLISPAMFKSFLSEHYSAVCETARSCGISVIDVDSDGCVDELIPLWIEAGVNLLHPFEVQAGMDVNQVRRDFGSDFAMRGGIDKRVLAHGRNEIKSELERIKPVYETGRYIPHIDHSIPPDVPFSNYLYYIDSLKKMIGF